MSGRVEYKVGEIFRYGGITYQCVQDSFDNGYYCGRCSMDGDECNEFMCKPEDRSDKTGVHYVKVTEPKEGMLFRASDGQRYKLKRYIQGETGCVCQLPAEYTTLSCEDIFLQSFGVYASPGLRWCLVEESKEKQEEKPKMEEVQPKRHLELSVVKVEGGKVTFRIAEQTHRNITFCRAGDWFVAGNGISLVSGESPGKEFDRNNKALLLRGFMHDFDDTEITVTLEEFAAIMQAVSEYNETDGRGYDKPWPQEGDFYYLVDESAQTAAKVFQGSYMDYRLQNIGNFFRSIKEADAAADRIRKALKGE